MPLSPWAERARTLSALSGVGMGLGLGGGTSARAALAGLPGGTARPASPPTVAFFPPVNPHAHVEAIHPLLPGPYLHNHLTVLARRTPIRESFDRVVRAKNAVRAGV